LIALRVCVIATRAYISGGSLIYAAAISYAALAAIFPLLLILLVVASPFIQPPRDIAHILDRFLVFPGVGDFLSRNVGAVYEHRAELGVTGGIGLILGASGVFGAIESALNRIWNVKGRGWISGRIVVLLALVIFALVFLMVLVALIFALRSLRDSPVGSSLPIVYGPSLLALVAPPLVIGLLFFLAYKFLPNAPVSTRSAFAGAMLAAVLADIALGIMSWYIGSIADYARFYNAAGAVFALLAWLYAFSNVFLLGAHVSAVMGRTPP
jgi:membrane protein